MKLYNSQTRKIEVFKSLKSKKVSMYVCGITPYDTTHLGHAFTYVSFDALFRFLQYLGYKVTYAQNVTDIDDDILKKAKEVGKNWKELGEYWTNKFLKDLKSLNVLFPTHYVKATDSIEKIIEINKILIEKKYAYEKNGNVYFAVKQDKNYGKLSRYTEKQMFLIAKDRGNDPKDTLKKHPLDFILWQKSKEDEPSWKSPWGIGRPGWHVECSAMIHQYLGEQIDIHGGGRDLIFPHHESEIAQSENFTGKRPFVQYWMHTAMLLYEGEKMSKSLGNLVMVSDLLKKYDANAIRWLLLSHHYRESWEYTNEKMEKANQEVFVIKKALLAKESTRSFANNTFKKIFEENMVDDLNVPVVLKMLLELANNIVLEKKEIKKNIYTIKKYISLLGFTL